MTSGGRYSFYRHSIRHFSDSRCIDFIFQRTNHVRRTVQYGTCYTRRRPLYVTVLTYSAALSFYHISFTIQVKQRIHPDFSVLYLWYTSMTTLRDPDYPVFPENFSRLSYAKTKMPCAMYSSRRVPHIASHLCGTHSLQTSRRPTHGPSSRQYTAMRRDPRTRTPWTWLPKR